MLVWFVLAAFTVLAAVSALIFRTMARRIREHERATADRICELACASMRAELMKAQAEAERAREREVRVTREAHAARKRLLSMAAETHRLSREVAILKEILSGPQVELDGPKTDPVRDRESVTDTAISVAPWSNVTDKPVAHLVRVEVK